jgi:hypothetical protein
MSYTPTTWSNSDIITAEKLNKIENGIVEAGNSGGGGSGVLVCTIDSGTAALNKTWQEVHDFAQTGIVIMTYDEDGTNYGYLVSVQSGDRGYILVFDDHGTNAVFGAESSNDYPVWTD